MSNEQPNPAELAAIRALFEAKQETDMKKLKEENESLNKEVRPMIERSNRLIKGEIDVNKLLPPSSQAQ